jgi:hypothetical protein
VSEHRALWRASLIRRRAERLVEGLLMAEGPDIEAVRGLLDDVAVEVESLPS